MPARATFLRVDSGGLLVHSPLGIDDETASHIDALGEVRFLVAPKCMHWLFLKAARDRYPGAQVLGAPGLEKKLRGVPFEPLPESGRIPGAGGVRVLRVQGAPIESEHAFFHENSRSLAVADLIFNIHATRSLVMQMRLRLGGAYRRTAQSRVWRFLVRDRAAAASSARTLLGWDRVVVAHGEVVVDRARDHTVEALRWMSTGSPPERDESRSRRSRRVPCGTTWRQRTGFRGRAYAAALVHAADKRFGVHCFFFPACLAAASAMATMRWNNVHIRYSR